jgi:glutaredoxin 3
MTVLLSLAMRKVTMYTTPICPYCVRAKALLRKKGVAVDEVDIFMDAGARETMLAKSGGARTVPQIFVGDTHVGGCDELYALERAGELDSLLAG